MENNNDYQTKYGRVLDQALEKTKKSVIGFFIGNYRFTYLIILFIILAGFYSAASMPREAQPEVAVPYAMVTTIYPGASPTDVEELVTSEIESEIKNLEALKQYDSSSGQGISTVFLEFEAEADLNESLRKLREAVDRSLPRLPDGAETPLVSEMNFNDFPIVTYSLTGDYSESELKSFADQLQDELESVRDVSRADIIGGLVREYQIIADETVLAHYGISLAQLAQAVSLANFSFPAGEIEIDSYKYNVRVKGRFGSIDDLKDVVVATYENTPVFLRDLALIKDAFREKESESKIGFPGQESQNTISLQVYKTSGGNILNIVDDSQSKIKELYQEGGLPPDLVVTKTNDNSIFIKEDLKTLGTSAIQTVILITIILMLVLSLRGAIITALAVPLAFLMAFLFLHLQGLTLNSMVLFSLVLSLGLMVDNAIIIIEGINEFVSEHKKSIMEAVLLSVWNFKWAITSGTMTTVSAFLPMLIVSGILGEYLSIIPKTITVTLLSSLVVALVIIPTLAARFIKIKDQQSGQTHRNKKRHIYLSKKVAGIKTAYRSYMEKTLNNRKKRRKILAIVWAFFIVAVIVPAGGFMKIQMFPAIDMDYFSVNIELPIGSNLDSTRQVSEEVEAIVAQIPEMDNYVVNIGQAASLGYGSQGGNGSHLAGITVNLKDKALRSAKSYEIASRLRERLAPLTSAEITVNELSAGPPSGSPIEVRIFGNDLKEIDAVAKDVFGFLERQEGLINIRDSLKESAGEFAFTVDKQKANYYGLNISSVSSALRQSIYGLTATEVNLGGEDIEVVVKYEGSEFKSLDDLNKIIVFNPRGEAIPLNQVASAELEPALLSISRRDGQKVAIVNADAEAGVDIAQVFSDFEAYQASILIPDTIRIETGGELEDIAQSFRELFLSMGLAVILIAAILVLQFNSFRQPFIIILSVPLAFIGVVAGLNLLRMPFSFTAFIGIVSLAGIVVNDAIVLIDRINKNIQNGMEFFAAIVESGVARMQPIFLTSITTIAGVFPLIWASELWRGLSVSIIFGLAFSTFLTLVMIPITYACLCEKECERATVNS